MNKLQLLEEERTARFRRNKTQDTKETGHQAIIIKTLKD